MTGPRAAVVGGGIAGLTAALRLRALGARVTLFEAADRVGGMIQTVRRAGWLIETGAGSASVPAEAQALLDPLGPPAGVVRAGPGGQRRYLVHQGRAVPVPASAAELVASPLLSLAGRMRFLKEPFVPRGTPDDEESVAAWARRRFGEEGAARFFDPLVAGTTGGDPEQLLARYTFPSEVDAERRSGSVLRGRLRAARTARREGRGPSITAPWSTVDGLEALPQQMLRALGADCRLGRRVAAITPSRAGVRLQDATGADHDFEAAVIAVPAPTLGAIAIGAPGAELLGEVASMPHASLVVVALGFRRSDVEHPLDGHGLLAASSERRRILGVQFSSSQFPGRAPADHVLLTATVGGARHPATISATDATIVATVMGELRDLLGVRGEPVVCEIARWPAALPLALAGHGRRLAAAARFEEGAPRLAFAGPWHDGLMIRDVMQGGVAAADRVTLRLGWPAIDRSA